MVPAAFGHLGNAVGLGGSQLPAGESAPNTAGGYRIIFGKHILVLLYPRLHGVMCQCRSHDVRWLRLHDIM